LPRRMQIEFSRAVQRLADGSGKEVTAADIHAMFTQEYFDACKPYAYRSHRMSSDLSGAVQLDIEMMQHGSTLSLQGSGASPVDAFVDALGLDVKLMDRHEHALAAGFACYVEVRVDSGPALFGAGIDADAATASFKAALSAINRHIASRKLEAETST